MEEMEVRKINSYISASSEDRTVEGYGAVWESPSVDMGFIEILHKGCIDEDTIKRSDCYAKFNHSDDKILARSKKGEGSLLLEVDDTGLRYLFEAPKTAVGDELLEYINRGDIDSSSFAFTIDPSEGSEKWSKRNGKIYRDVYKINQIFDVSPVWAPAYPATTCSKRFAEIQETIQEVESVMSTLRKEVEDL